MIRDKVPTAVCNHLCLAGAEQRSVRVGWSCLRASNMQPDVVKRLHACSKHPHTRSSRTQGYTTLVAFERERGYDGRCPGG